MSETDSFQSSTQRNLEIEYTSYKLAQYSRSAIDRLFEGIENSEKIKTSVFLLANFENLHINEWDSLANIGLVENFKEFSERKSLVKLSGSSRPYIKLRSEVKNLVASKTECLISVDNEISQLFSYIDRHLPTGGCDREITPQSIRYISVALQCFKCQAYQNGVGVQLWPINTLIELLNWVVSHEGDETELLLFQGLEIFIVLFSRKSPNIDSLALYDEWNALLDCFSTIITNSMKFELDERFNVHDRVLLIDIGRTLKKVSTSIFQENLSTPNYIQTSLSNLESVKGLSNSVAELNVKIKGGTSKRLSQIKVTGNIVYLSLIHI